MEYNISTSLGINDSESYDYDPTDSWNYYNLSDLIPTTIVYGTTLIIGLLGNSLIIYTVLTFQRMRTISNIFLASLATADLLLILICVPVKYWPQKRYYAIIHPVKSRYLCTVSQARRVIIAIWIASFVAAIPIIFTQIHMRVGERQIAYWCVRNWDQRGLWQIYELYMLLLILIAPSIIMGYAYIRICHQLWIVVKERASMTSGEMPGTELQVRESHPKNQYSTQVCVVKPKPKSSFHKMNSDSATVKQVIKMLVAVVLLFILCWSPILITNVLTAFGIVDELNIGHLKPLRTAFHLMSYFNSCVNPCVYGFMSQNFRNSFQIALKSCLCGRQKIKGQPSVNRTTTTSVNYGRSTFIT
ncbi:trissin receptor-like [Centruroides sculpturatus]|uniref:trissin receptor-like n=1 Tax=Centruroides sculpturatus TaxID=218467 RepID=UPI000C6CBB6E|nr:trissin receptor-like [Centruroides sculpturatus]